MFCLGHVCHVLCVLCMVYGVYCVTCGGGEVWCMFCGVVGSVFVLSALCVGCGVSVVCVV